MLADKLEELKLAIATKVAVLDLIFVDGPDPDPKPTPSPTYSKTNGQDRAVLLLAVAERE